MQDGHLPLWHHRLNHDLLVREVDKSAPCVTQQGAGGEGSSSDHCLPSNASRLAASCGGVQVQKLLLSCCRIANHRADSVLRRLSSRENRPPGTYAAGYSALHAVSDEALQRCHRFQSNSSLCWPRLNQSVCRSFCFRSHGKTRQRG